MIRLIARHVTVDAEAGKKASRTISGLAVPWNETAVVNDGTAVRFLPGSLPEDGKAPRLVEAHDISQILGLVTERVNTDDGMLFSAKIAATRDGDDALELLKMGALDSVSIGANPIDWEIDSDGTMVVSAAEWVELSLVAIPAFSSATISDVAASANQETIEMSETTPEIDTAAESVEVEAAAPATIPTPAAPIYAQVRRPQLPSPGEYLLSFKRGGSDFAELNARIAAELQASATGNVTVSQADGVVPVPILGPVYDDINPLRPIVTALGTRAMPEAGATFIRPFVKVHSAVDAQATELTNLAVADFEIDDLVVTKKTFGGRLQLSEQVIDWSAPSMLDQAITDLAGQYAIRTEKETVDTIAAGTVKAQETVTDLTDGEEIVEKLYEAAAAIAAVGNYLPNVAVVAPAVWAKLGAAADSDGRPLFPVLGPTNAPGALASGATAWNGNILGLTLIVSNQVDQQDVGNKEAKDYIWLANTRGVEVYEMQKGFVSLENPANLSLQIAVRGYFAASIMDNRLIRQLGPAATFS